MGLQRKMNNKPNYCQIHQIISMGENIQFDVTSEYKNATPLGSSTIYKHSNSLNFILPSTER
jgi:hypothetical protein